MAKEIIILAYLRFTNQFTCNYNRHVMTYYFIKDGDKELGPFTVKQLKSRSIRKDTPVWFAGLQEWTNADQVYEIKDLFITRGPERSFYRNKIDKIWNHKVLKRQIKKVSYQLILIRARKNLY